MQEKDVWFKDFPVKEKIKIVQKIGREIFSTPNGAIFLSVLLDDLYFTRPATTEREVALKNYATYLLKERLGLTNDTLAVTTSLLSIPLNEESSTEDSSLK
jgi:hypothetical protein